MQVAIVVMSLLLFLLLVVAIRKLQRTTRKREGVSLPAAPGSGNEREVGVRTESRDLYARALQKTALRPGFRLPLARDKYGTWGIQRTVSANRINDDPCCALRQLNSRNDIVSRMAMETQHYPNISNISETQQSTQPTSSTHDEPTL